MTLGGRAAEEIIFNKISTGAQNDLERITKMAYSMVTMYGMNDKIGHLSYYDANRSEYSQRPYSDATATLIDQEVKKIVDEAYDRTLKLLKEKQSDLEIIAKELLEKEILFQTDLTRLIGKRPFDKETTYEAFTEQKTELEAKSDAVEETTKEVIVEKPSDEANKVNF
jgi:AFG3 family protein